MLQAHLVSSDGTLVSGGRELLDSPLDEGTCLWIDLLGPAQEHEQLLEQLGYHPLAIEDTFTLHHQPKIEDYDDYLFLIARGIDFNVTGRLTTLKLAAFLGPRRLVTVHRAPLRSVEAVRLKLEEAKKPFRGGTVQLLHRILDELMGLYFPLLEEMRESVGRLEEEIFVEQPQPEHLETILDLLRRLAEVRRVMMPHRQVFAHLTGVDSEVLDDKDRRYFSDIYDEVFRLADSADLLREQLSGVRDAYLAVVGQRTNEVMKTLTILSAVLLPLTFIAGLYGMNFHYMPELRSPFGYPGVLAAMAGIAVAMVAWFRHKGWF